MKLWEELQKEEVVGKCSVKKSVLAPLLESIFW